MPTPEEKYNEAEQLKDEGKFEEAIEKLCQLVEEHPDFALAHSALAVVYGKVGKHDQAIQHGLKVCELEPNDARTIADLRGRVILLNPIDPHAANEEPRPQGDLDIVGVLRVVQGVERGRPQAGELLLRPLADTELFVAELRDELLHARLNRLGVGLFLTGLRQRGRRRKADGGQKERDRHGCRARGRQPRRTDTPGRNAGRR